MDKQPWDWTREHLDRLIGQIEGVRLEFKSSRVLLEDKNNSIERIASNLSSEVSAFANTEGGVIVIGVSEKKEGKARIAESIDEGVNLANWSPERLQSLIEGNISPYLTGIRIKAIPLDDNRSKVAYVISIPQGTTAYQASDRKYYGRSEFEAKALPDHEVRLRMFRGKSAKATIISDRFMKRRSEINQANFSKLETSRTENAKNSLRYVDEYFFRISLINTGEINISEFKVVLFAYPEHLFEKSDFEFIYRDKDTYPSIGPYLSNSQMKVNIYPQDVYHVAEIKVTVAIDIKLSQHNPQLNWKLFLKDSFPIEGILNLSTETIPYHK